MKRNKKIPTLAQRASVASENVAAAVAVIESGAVLLAQARDEHIAISDDAANQAEILRERAASLDAFADDVMARAYDADDAVSSVPNLSA